MIACILLLKINIPQKSETLVKMQWFNVHLLGSFFLPGFLVVYPIGEWDDFPMAMDGLPGHSSRSTSFPITWSVDCGVLNAWLTLKCKLCLKIRHFFLVDQALLHVTSVPHGRPRETTWRRTSCHRRLRQAAPNPLAQGPGGTRPGTGGSWRVKPRIFQVVGRWKKLGLLLDLRTGELLMFFGSGYLYKPIYLYWVLGGTKLLDVGEFQRCDRSTWSVSFTSDFEWHGWHGHPW